jgi:hypothetical protein
MAILKLKVQIMSEAQNQIALVRWLRWKKIPAIHIPNEGKRSVATAKWLDSMGMTKGASDLFIARPKLSQDRYYGGFWIELKAKGKKPTTMQYEFLHKMTQEGYKTGWYDNWDDARKAIEDYLMG